MCVPNWSEPGFNPDTMLAADDRTTVAVTEAIRAGDEHAGTRHAARGRKRG